MQYWTMTDGAGAGTGMTRGAVIIVDALRCAFEEMSDPRPRLLSLGRHDDILDDCRYEARIELSPGVTLPVSWGSPEFVSGAVEYQGDELEFAKRIIDNVSALRARFDPAYLGDVLHDARQRARRVLAEWQGAGHSSRLEDVRLAPLEYWRDVNVPQLTVLIEGLNWSLRPEIWELQAGHHSIEHLLASVYASHVRRLERRAELWQEGAAGSIDRIALNAIAHFGDVAEGIRRFASQDMFRLPDDTSVSNLHGHVSIGNGHPQAGWVWHDDGVTVFQDEQVPDIVLKAANGRPTTALLDHPFLSEDVIITDAAGAVDVHGTWSVTVSFEQPKLLFCSSSGRVWHS